MQDYYQFRMKLLRGAEGGPASALFSWIGLAGVPLILAMVVVAVQFGGRDYLYAIPAVFIFYFLAHISEVYPKLGTWPILAGCFAGFTFCLWVLVMPLVSETFDAEPRTLFVVLAFLVFFFLIFRVTLVQANAALDRPGHDARIPFLLLAILSAAGFVAGVLASTLNVDLDNLVALTITVGSYFSLATAAICLIYLVRNPVRVRAWLDLLVRMPNWVKLPLVGLYVAVAIEAVVLNVVLERPAQDIIYVMWPLFFGLSSLILAWASVTVGEAES